MGKRGPKKLPTILQLLRGNPGKRALNKNEPLPSTDNISPPVYLTGAPLAKWNQLVPSMIATGVMTNADVDAIARYCMAHEQWVKCATNVKAGLDQIPVYDDAGKIIMIRSTPDAIMVHKYYSHLLRIEQEFGMTASSRSAIVVKKPDAAEEEIDPRIFG